MSKSPYISKRWCGWTRDLMGPQPWVWIRQGETIRSTEDYCLNALAQLFPSPPDSVYVRDDENDVVGCRWTRIAIPIPQTPYGKLEF